MSLREFCATVGDYRILPQRLAFPSALILIGLELALGIALWFPMARSLALVGSAGLLTLYATAIGVNLLRGRRHIDCGCSAPGLRQPLRTGLVWRNLALAAAAMAGSLPAASRALVWVDTISIIACVGVLAALYATFNRLLANKYQLMSLVD